MSNLIEKKIQKTYFDGILDGSKTFELRLADWECNEGDMLCLKEVDSEGNYTGRELTRKVGFIVKTKNIQYFTDEEVEKYGFQVISLVNEEQA